MSGKTLYSVVVVNNTLLPECWFRDQPAPAAIHGISNSVTTSSQQHPAIHPMAMKSSSWAHLSRGGGVGEDRMDFSRQQNRATVPIRICNDILMSTDSWQGRRGQPEGGAVL